MVFHPKSVATLLSGPKWCTDRQTDIPRDLSHTWFHWLSSRVVDIKKNANASRETSIHSPTLIQQWIKEDTLHHVKQAAEWRRISIRPAVFSSARLLLLLLPTHSVCYRRLLQHKSTQMCSLEVPGAGQLFCSTV